MATATPKYRPVSPSRAVLAVDAVALLTRTGKTNKRLLRPLGALEFVACEQDAADLKARRTDGAAPATAPVQMRW